MISSTPPPTRRSVTTATTAATYFPPSLSPMPFPAPTRHLFCFANPSLLPSLPSSLPCPSLHRHRRPPLPPPAPLPRACACSQALSPGALAAVRGLIRDHRGAKQSAPAHRAAAEASAAGNQALAAARLSLAPCSPRAPPAAWLYTFLYARLLHGERFFSMHPLDFAFVNVS